ncbi:uncharacterized protein LOC129774277 [Toxorhynchites rutilus septentrionalis]|uniref:uncharacterized protein LOC129774277 n=1 Tax=Toxorhynchites rutilus septentrionalis TaxID=329112 RepID=UPI00247879F9|nr:uncharacterized protein LOC129774277 [Toxorhynchites rutilus septentrionalis]
MEICYIILAICLAASSVLSETSLQVKNRQIWNNFCSPQVLNIDSSRPLQAFMPICFAFARNNARSCCDIVAQTIRVHPTMELCPSDSGYLYNVAGCGVGLSGRGSLTDDGVTESSDFRFPSESTPVKPSASGTAYELVFSNNPGNNIRVMVADARPQDKTASFTRKPATPTSDDDDDEYEQEVPPIVTNTPGYRAMNFALRLFQNLDRTAHSNSVISPLLPQQLLSNLIDVSSPKAHHQLQSAIQLYPEQLDVLQRALQKASRSTVNTIETAAVNFVAKHVRMNKTYEDLVKLRNVDVLRVDFSQPSQTARKANDWISEKTHRLINEIITPGSITGDTRLLLANSIFFKGKWKYSFIQTEPGNFESSPGIVRPVNRMFQLNKLRYGKLSFPDGNGLRWVELPYEGESLSMLIFLPTKRHQLEASLRQLQTDDLAKVMAQIQQSYINTKVDLHLPRFTLTDSVSLIPALQRLGVDSIFHDQEALPHLINEPTVVSDITQRSYLSVDEQGTKATSVASLSIVTLSITPQYRDVQFDVDEPFLVMIVDKQERYPIFIGQIYEPHESFLTIAVAHRARYSKPATEAGGFRDERNCASRASANVSDKWECLCQQLNYERATCESDVFFVLENNPSIKLCTDQQSYYFGANQKCHYETQWESSNDPAGKAMNFALDLFRTGDPKNPNENYIVSPLSPQILLAQLTDGCSEPARVELIKTLKLNSAEANALVGNLVDAANKDSNLNKLDIASVYFKSIHLNLTEKFNAARKENRIKIQDVDFSDTQQAVHTVNDWANHATRGSIPEVVTEQNLDPEISILLLNAIYFKGTWQYKFNETDTNKHGTFEVTKDQRMPVQMMSQSNRLRFGEINLDQYPDHETNGLRWIELPYDGDELSMILLLPKTRHQLDENLQQIKSSHLQDIFQVLRRNHKPIQINVKLPKFTIKNSISLVEPLKKLGVKRIFEDDTALSGLSKSPTKVGDVKQDAFLSVDEKGTTAAAVTKVTIIPLSLNAFEDMTFYCDEPFMVMVVDKTKEIPLFMAKVRQPLKTKKANRT